ncbi:MAG: CHAD domain-containing protein [Oxalobacteraceae bacterium]|nr:CHAD domain-containing protein [Oxalobacteraceae bacterium]
MNQFPGVRMETELKLLLDPADVAVFRRHPLLRRYALARPVPQQLTSIYFDTPDGYFRRHDAGLRVRLVQRQWIQTLKADGQVAAGLHQRQEWESPVAGAVPDLAALADLVGAHGKWGRRLRKSGLGAQLEPIFTTRFKRTLWQLRLEHGEEVELVLDQGEIVHADARLPISEIELELKSGDPAGLFAFALQLQQAVPLRVGNISKAERGYALLAPQAPTVAVAARLLLAPDLSVEQGLQAIVGNCLAQIQGNEDGVMHGSDPESVHQMRVGLRRLRCASGLFARLAPCPAALQIELKWLLGILGAARDWEVFSGTLDTLADAGPVPAQWDALQQAAHRLAHRHRRRAGLALGSVRYAAFLLALGSWLHSARGSPEQGDQGWASPLADFAANTLQKCHRTLKKRVKRLQDDTPQARHRVRIAAKKLRYSSEFFQSLYRPKRMRAYLKALSGLQDRLGRLNDVAVAGRLLGRLAHSHPELAYSAGLVHGYLEARTESAIRTLGRRGRQCMPGKIPALQSPHKY